jgi:hypothetical protein
MYASLCIQTAVMDENNDGIADPGSDDYVRVVQVAFKSPLAARSPLPARLPMTLMHFIASEVSLR